MSLQRDQFDPKFQVEGVARHQTDRRTAFSWLDRFARNACSAYRGVKTRVMPLITRGHDFKMPTIKYEFNERNRSFAF